MQKQRRIEIRSDKSARLVMLSGAVELELKLRGRMMMMPRNKAGRS